MENSELSLKYHQAFSPGGITPPRFGDCGYDIAASESRVIFPGCLEAVSTCAYIEIPVGYFGVIRDRSSLALKRLRVAGGVIDPSFRGEVRVMIENCGHTPYAIEPGDRIAQLIFVPYVTPKILTTYSPTDLSITPRGDRGFGSTGK